MICRTQWLYVQEESVLMVLLIQTQVRSLKVRVIHVLFMAYLTDKKSAYIYSLVHSTIIHQFINDLSKLYFADHITGSSISEYFPVSLSYFVSNVANRFSLVRKGTFNFSFAVTIFGKYIEGFNLHHIIHTSCISVCTASCTNIPYAMTQVISASIKITVQELGLYDILAQLIDRKKQSCTVVYLTHQP